MYECIWLLEEVILLFKELLCNLYILEFCSTLTFCTWCVLMFCYDILSIWIITFGIRASILGFFFPQESHLEIFTITFFRATSESETWRLFRRLIKVPVVQISASGSLYFQRYTLWKIWFLTSPITSLKQVFRVKQSYLIHRGSKFQ
jgi:hypothetical protein